MKFEHCHRPVGGVLRSHRLPTERPVLPGGTTQHRPDDLGTLTMMLPQNRPLRGPGLRVQARPDSPPDRLEAGSAMRFPEVSAHPPHDREPSDEEQRGRQLEDFKHCHWPLG